MHGPGDYLLSAGLAASCARVSLSTMVGLPAPQDSSQKKYVILASLETLRVKILVCGSIIRDAPKSGSTNTEASMKLWQIIRAYTFYLRKVAFYSATKRSFGLLPYIYNRLWLNHYRFRYGFEISPTTKIGPGLYIGHFGGVVISPYAILGSNVNIAQGITIGAASRGARRGAPTLGDRVWVGANAIIVGKVTIGDDALIAPGAYVNFDVPEKSIVIGNPGKIVSTSGSAGYINNTLDVTDTAVTE